MSDLLEVFSRGDHFGTYAADGRVLIWVVVADGLVKLQPSQHSEPHGPRWPGDQPEPPADMSRFPDPGMRELQ